MTIHYGGLGVCIRLSLQQTLVRTEPQPADVTATTHATPPPTRSCCQSEAYKPRGESGIGSHPSLYLTRPSPMACLALASKLMPVRQDARCSTMKRMSMCASVYL